MAARTAATCAALHCAGVALGLSGYTSVVVRKHAPDTLAHRPSALQSYSITPGATTGEPIRVPSGSAGAMWVISATAALTACWNAGSGAVLSAHR